LSRNDQRYFEELKKKIVAMMQQSFPGINPNIAEWKGQEITDFQEELLKSVNAHISEKWFYTHMKSVSRSLPRIDVLNLLSKYAGYANWDDFVFRNQDLIEAAGEAHSAQAVSKAAPDRSNRFFIIVPIVTVCIVLIFFVVFKVFNTREYKFCFYDADTREPITNTRIEVKVLLEGESPATSFCNSDGCFSFKTDKSVVRMVVSSPYYNGDTIKRSVRKLQPNEIIKLHANDYALMIHYFSQMKVDDWERRRTKLQGMIDDGAVIYQVYGEKNAVSGMALLNKQEFIDKLTMPSGSLKNIEVLDTRLKDGKIAVLRFRVKPAAR